MNSIRVAAIEDDDRYRDSLATLFRHAPGFAWAGGFESAEAAFRHLDRRGAVGPAWDVVLMDLNLPGADGVAATAALKQRTPAAAVVVLTVFEDPASILRAICAGADGYLLKRTAPAELIRHLETIVAGGAPLTAGVARTILETLRDTVPPVPASGTGLELTAREREVLQGLVQGQGYKQVAAMLGVSLDTVRTHVRSIYRKLQVHSVAAAVSRALRERLI